MTKYKLNQDLRTPSQVTLTSYMVGESRTDPVGQGEQATGGGGGEDAKGGLECRGCTTKSKCVLVSRRPTSRYRQG